MCVLSPGRYKTEIQQSTSSDIDGTRVGLVWRASRGYISGRGITSAAQSSLQPSLGVVQEILYFQQQSIGEGSWERLRDFVPGDLETNML